MGTLSKLQRRMNRTGSERSAGFANGGSFAASGESTHHRVQSGGSLEDLDVQRLLAAYSSPPRRPDVHEADDYPNVAIEGDGLTTATCGVTSSFYATDAAVETQSVQAYVLHAAFKIKVECASVCVAPGRWKLSYVVTTAGKWDLYVYVCGSAGQMPVRNSPFSVAVLPNVVSPQTSTLDGPGLSQAKQAERNVVFLTLVDAYGNVVPGKDYSIRVALSDCRYECETRWQADGKMEISYTPIVRKHTSVDSIELEVFVNAQLVQGSAFAVPYYCTPEQVEEELGHILKSLADVREFLTDRRTSGWVRRKKRVQWKQTYVRILLKEIASEPQLSVSCYASEDAREPIEQIPLLNTTLKPFTTKRMLAGQLEGFSLQHGDTAVEFGCVSKADRDEWCENIQAMIKFSNQYLGLEATKSTQANHTWGVANRAGAEPSPTPLTISESKEDLTDEVGTEAPRVTREHSASATISDITVHMHPVTSTQNGWHTEQNATAAPELRTTREPGKPMERMPHKALSNGEMSSPRSTPVPDHTRQTYTAASTDSNELRRSEAATAAASAAAAAANQRRVQRESSTSNRTAQHRDPSPRPNTNRTVPSIMPDHDDLEDFFLGAGNSALLSDGRASSTGRQNGASKIDRYARASFLNPSNDSRIATPDQSPERRRGQIDNIDSLQADAAQWNRVMKWLKSIGQTKYAENFKTHGFTQLAIIELARMEDLIQIGVEPEDREIILEEIVKFSSSTMRWASKAMMDDSLSRTSSHTTIIPDPMHNELMAHFDAHDKDTFFSLWWTVVPVDSLRSADHPLYQTTRSLEFYLHVYFAICPLLDGADEETLQREMMAFRRYVESESRKGGLLAQSADFAAYAGLFLVPQPHKNPAYKGLFQEEWTASLRERVHAYLTVVLGRGGDTNWGEHPLSPPKQKMLQFDPASVNLPIRSLHYGGSSSPDQAKQSKQPKQSKQSTTSRRNVQTPSRPGRAQSAGRGREQPAGTTTRSTNGRPRTAAANTERTPSRHQSRPRQGKSEENFATMHSPINRERQRRKPPLDTSSPAALRQTTANTTANTTSLRSGSRTPQRASRPASRPQPSTSKAMGSSGQPGWQARHSATTSTAARPFVQRMRAGTTDSRGAGSRAPETDDISKLRAMIQAKRQGGARAAPPPYQGERVAFLGTSGMMPGGPVNGAAWHGAREASGNWRQPPSSPGRKPANSRFDHWNGNQRTSIL